MKNNIWHYLLIFAYINNSINAASILPIAQDSNKKFINAIENNDINEVAKLISEGIDINSVNDKGDTALYIAAFKSNTPMVEMLVYAGANEEALTNAFRLSCRRICVFHPIYNTHKFYMDYTAEDKKIYKLLEKCMLDQRRNDIIACSKLNLQLLPQLFNVIVAYLPSKEDEYYDYLKNLTMQYEEIEKQIHHYRFSKLKDSDNNLTTYSLKRSALSIKSPELKHKDLKPMLFFGALALASLCIIKRISK